VKINLPPLDCGARKQVWKNSFDMLKTDRVAHNLGGLIEHLDELAEEQMNGREIHNLMTTARQIASFKNERLDWEHLSNVITVEREINKRVRRSTHQDIQQL
jgi:hypothetical protein